MLLYIVNYRSFSYFFSIPLLLQLLIVIDINVSVVLALFEFQLKEYQVAQEYSLFSFLA